MPSEGEGRDQGDASVHQGMPRTASKPPEAREEAWNRFFSQPSEGINSANTLILDL